MLLRAKSNACKFKLFGRIGQRVLHSVLSHYSVGIFVHSPRGAFTLDHSEWDVPTPHMECNASIITRDACGAHNDVQTRELDLGQGSGDY